ncbi:MAG: transglycosylase SLT domain-containing protein [Alistipes sp.]|nr:transglycosylase SLT domain-containing protein [Alistipes sp.]
MIKSRLSRVVVPLLFVVVAATVAVAVVAMARRDVAEPKTVVAVGDTPTSMIPYESLFRRVGKAYDVDWRLLAAIARAESKFRFDAVSSVGAVGLMQIMPYVAERMGVARDGLFDVEVSVTLAARLLRENEKMLQLGRNFDSEERLRFILACYNAGYSRICDARRLATYYKDDANKWSVVSTYLALLSEAEFFEHESVESGAFYGSDETVAYVDVVMHYFHNYCHKIEL